jgi:glycosyltransferase involved in cell wall biosynthesis
MAILAHARPLITTMPEKPVPSLNHGQNVWLTPVEDPVALAQAMQMLPRKRKLRANLGFEAGQTASQYSWPSIAKQTASFFENIVDSEN